jgi:hypothetical protein
MSAGFIPPDHWSETSSQLRWVITSIVVSTNQSSVAQVVPYATLALNTTDFSQMSQGNQRGTTYSGNNDTYSSPLDVGPCDFASVLFYPPPGSSPSQIAQLSGVIATAVVLGTKYTRRK